MKNFISIEDFSKEEILEILDTAKSIDSKLKKGDGNKKIVANLFFEPSTRTRLSFTSSAYRLGADVLGFDSSENTSVKKGESLRDTIKVVEGYADVIVMRHSIEGACKFAQEISDIPLINAGDGSNEHPSQTFLDLFTIQNEFQTLEGLKIAFVGDLKYGRTVHSLIKAMENFDVKFYFIAPPEIQIPKYITDDLDDKKIEYEKHSDYQSILKEIDVLYMTRIQKERFENQDEYEKVRGVYKVSKADILGKCKESMIVMHPLPRVDEIDIDVDDTKYARYFEQAKNGIPIRETLFAYALGYIKTRREKNYHKESKKIVEEGGETLCKNQKCVTQFEKTKNRVIVQDKKRYCYYCGKEIV